MLKDIYIIKNDINDKVYIGQAIDAKQRFQSHCKPSAATLNNELIGKAIQKYGREHFWYEILANQVYDYNSLERFYIQKYNSVAPYGYNLLDGGEEPPLLRGCEHPEAKLDETQIIALTEDLRNGHLNFTELAKKYKFVSNTSIIEFNQGLTYVRDIDYPIRGDIKSRKLNLQDIETIIKLLQYTYRSFESIGNQFGVEYRTIARINKGVTYKKEGISYPIRNSKPPSKKAKLTYEEVTDIISLLLNTQNSLRSIAKQFNVEYEDILHIKNGNTKLYRRKDLIYPLRPNN